MSHNKVSFLRQGATAAFDNTLLELRLVNCSLASFQAELSMFNALTNSLDFSQTSVRYWPSALSSLTRLQYLDMSHNKVSFLRQGATAAFDNTLLELRLVNCSLASFQAELSMFNALTLLDLSDNAIKDIPTGSLNAVATTLTSFKLVRGNLAYLPATLTDLKALQLLDLSDNAIKDIPAGSLKAVAATLTSFKLVRGNLAYLPAALTDLKALQEVDLSENPMVSTNNDVLGVGSSPLLANSAHTLRTLRLASCGLVAVPRALLGLDALQELDLSDNGIVTLNNYQFDSMVNLEKLYLRGNPISTVPYKTFSGLTSLSMLDMSGGRLTYAPSSALGEMPALSQLDLSKNRISVLLDNTFPKSPSLTTVDLSYNTITNISDMAFQGATALQTLKMNDCSLTSIPRSLRLAYGLRSVYLDNNPIPCNCQSMGWIKTWKLSAGLIPHLFGQCFNGASLSIDLYISTMLGGCDVPIGR
ncbi:hypothetical protein EGW08_013905 [Elysia chlorotica]|uniref:LRRCT domain-containing protein n=1 Tax=Elysia chlorotica TaxID=188477 RepID=A0A433T9Q2_ELYCH|nr:hypothetical protein EGW08_013905 [Elysia chlorotica]